MIDLNYERRFKSEYGIYPTELSRSIMESRRKLDQDFEEMILKTSGYPNGFHPNQVNGNKKVFPYNWDKVAELEAAGVGDMLDPWLPAPCERVGKTWLELNIMADERKNNYITNKGKG